ncbi:MAG TPA: hypothetical protein DER09_04655 [Prolixibacteraceae bacterium]|nr:hypothetical protein [Prolixibacteraceae bacterium]
MKTTENYLSEIKEIRKMMEQSSRFLSLSGLSGVLIGIYALAGSFVAYRMIYFSQFEFVTSIFSGNLVFAIIAVAMLVLTFSIITTLILTWRRAGGTGKSIWNPGSRLMLINLSIPFISGGLFILIFTFKGFYDLASPACLIFYGLALINAAKFTRQEIFYLGILQIVLGIFAAIFPQLGILLWALGFGVLHIIYGTVMYFRYERPSK